MWQDATSGIWQLGARLYELVPPGWPVALLTWVAARCCPHGVGMQQEAQQVVLLSVQAW
jgi:hypothetical protein